MDRLLFPIGTTWKARRELDALFSNVERSAATSQRCLHLLREHPSLAKQRHQHWLHCPLSFLLESGADLPSVMEVYAMYPPALSQRVTLRQSCTIFPLHVACEQGRVAQDVIPFLVQQCPRATRQRNWHKESPLHLILRNPHRSASVAEVQALLDHSHDGAIQEETSMHRATPLSIAFQNEHTSEEVMNVLIQRLPTDFTKLELGGTSTIRNNGVISLSRPSHRHARMSLKRAHALCKILPRLKVFHCLVPDWDPDAFDTVLENLPSLFQLEELTMTMVHLDDDEDATPLMTAFRRLLEHTNNLRLLLLEFTVPYQKEKFELKSRVIRAFLEQLLDGLRQNDSLVELHLYYGGVKKAMNELSYFTKEFWPSLCRLLETNTTLKQATVSLGKQGDSKGIIGAEEQRARFLMNLNQYGRCRFRNASSVTGREVASMLDAVNQSSDLSIGNDKLDAIYGLLSQAPVVWSSIALR
ncbi:expressed unknown protein [Seminavis robusta]|uniref:Uncharacterized protein n=1 Tax=Seminavis robusta TaxID=568900 RepID=A0A9N8DRF3_9STRA|nr:expressed unknown protein [Seminavis robusta]|eukprot:Sro298_g111230.1 n/a (471) ;mRNA; f:68693-70105